jgi:hypothetical protein
VIRAKLTETEMTSLQPAAPSAPEEHPVSDPPGYQRGDHIALPGRVPIARFWCGWLARL